MAKRDSIRCVPYRDGLIRSYDYLGYYIKQNETGAIYEEAIDIPCKYTYSETNKKIPVQPENIKEE